MKSVLESPEVFLNENSVRGGKVTPCDDDGVLQKIHTRPTIPGIPR